MLKHKLTVDGLQHACDGQTTLHVVCEKVIWKWLNKKTRQKMDIQPCILQVRVLIWTL
jgi:hypothetical protein